MVNKKIIAVLLCVFMGIGNLSFFQTRAGAEADVTPPELISISIDKTSVVSGESVKVRIEATDNGGSGIKYVTVYYETPITDKSKYIDLKMVQDGVYEGSLILTDADESGVWKISRIHLTDNVLNTKVIYNSNLWSVTPNQDLSNCNFELTGTIADVTPPELKSISINKMSVVVGDSVKVRMEATDNGGSGIKYVTVYYKTPITDKSKYIDLKMVQDGVYEGSLILTDADESGVWKISRIHLTDNVLNTKVIYNSNLWSVTPNQDLSNCDFELKENLIKQMPQAYVTQNETWTSKVIEGDLYIGPNAVLTINGPVTVNGNIYVLGALKSYGTLTVKNTIYARRFIFGSSTLYNGTVLFLGGTNNISSLVASSAPIEIPWKIYESNNKTITVVNNMLNVTGAIVPVADLYAAGAKVNCYSNGTFNLQMDVTDKDSITFETVDVYGNRKATTYYLVKVSEPITTPVTGVTLDISEAALKVNESLKLSASVNPWDASVKDVAFSSGNESVVKVDNNGVVTAVGPGTADITVTTIDGRYTASCRFTVVQPVSGITLDKKELTTKIGQTMNLIASISPTNATNKEITWTSSDTNIARVDSSGKITAVGKGSTTVTATTFEGGYSASCTVTVTKPVVGISLDRSEGTLKIGDKLTLNASVNPIDASNTSIVWSSNNPGVAKVDQSGNVTALGKGTAIVTVRTVDGNFTANCAITVVKPVTGVSIDKSQVTIDYGASTTLTAAVAPVDASNNGISWSSSNTSVAIVDKLGKVTGVGEGSAIITATTVDGGFKAACEVTVNKPTISVTLNKTTATINKGTTLQLTAKVLPEILPNKSVSWSSSNPSVATVDNKGLVTALEKGTAIITVKTEDGEKTAQCTVTVAANSVINKIRYGGTTRFTTAVEVSKAGWTTSENVVLVNAYGFADALTGVPFAHLKNAPILLTESGSLTTITMNEILRLKAKNIYILGGTGVVSKGVEDNLKSRGYNVYRVAGSGRFETAMAIGNQVIAAGGSKTAVLTTAYNYPDALAISSYAAINKIPILYTDPAKFTESTKTFIIKNGITKIIIPGGTGAVSSAIEKDLKSRGITVQRIAGANRYSTAYNIVNTFKSSFKNDVMIATGANFPDALSGGALAAKMQIPILLVQQNSIDADSAAFIRSKGNVNLYILGGSGVIADSIIK